MNPYDIDIKSIKTSTKITDKVDLLKIKLLANIVNNNRHLTQKEIAKITKLDKADVSRLVIGDYKRFSVKKLIQLNHAFGYGIKLVIDKNDQD